MKKLRKKLSELVSLPESAFGVTPFIEIEGSSSVKINGCREIIDYTSSRVIIMTADYPLTVEGSELTLLSYGERTALVQGMISRLSLGGENA